MLISVTPASRLLTVRCRAADHCGHSPLSADPDTYSHCLRYARKRRTTVRFRCGLRPHSTYIKGGRGVPLSFSFLRTAVSYSTASKLTLNILSSHDLRTRTGAPSFLTMGCR